MTYVLAGGKNLDLHSLAFICISNKELASGGSQNKLTHNNKITAIAISATAALDCWEYHLSVAIIYNLTLTKYSA